MRTYTQLTREKRYQIYALLKEGSNLSAIAKNIGVHKSTVCREIKRNQGFRGYRPKQAHLLAVKRRESKIWCRFDVNHWRIVDGLIRQDWSPKAD